MLNYQRDIFLTKERKPTNTFETLPNNQVQPNRPHTAHARRLKGLVFLFCVFYDEKGVSVNRLIKRKRNQEHCYSTCIFCHYLKPKSFIQMSTLYHFRVKSNHFWRRGPNLPWIYELRDSFSFHQPKKPWDRIYAMSILQRIQDIEGEVSIWYTVIETHLTIDVKLSTCTP